MMDCETRVQGLAVEKRQAATVESTNGRESTAVPGVERAPTPVAARACGTWKPRLGPAGDLSGGLTVRKADPLAGKDGQEANAGTPKGDGKPGQVGRHLLPLARITGRIRATARPERVLTWPGGPAER